MYAQSGNRRDSGFLGVEVYSGKNLEQWDGPRPVLTLPEDSGVVMVWAPEVHAYQGAYYLFVTLTHDKLIADTKPVDSKRWPEMKKRGTWVFRSDVPEGPFKPLKNESHTPPSWMALDGTLQVENETPYMVFCHEWVQLIDGRMAAVRLTADLSGVAADPITLFRASDAPGAKTGPNEGKVTDGPFLYRSPKSGTLFMIWSTFLAGKGYCVMLARSRSGGVAGPWEGHAPIYEENGGHGMIFTALDGRLLMALHQPNTGDLERLRLIELADEGETLRVRAP